MCLMTVENAEMLEYVGFQSKLEILFCELDDELFPFERDLVGGLEEAGRTK